MSGLPAHIESGVAYKSPSCCNHFRCLTAPERELAPARLPIKVPPLLRLGRAPSACMSYETKGNAAIHHHITKVVTKVVVTPNDPSTPCILQKSENILASNLGVTLDRHTWALGHPDLNRGLQLLSSPCRIRAMISAERPYFPSYISFSSRE